MKDQREDKLPVWAKNLLREERLARTAAELQLRERLETVETTRISYGDSKNPIYIPSDFGLQTVRFDLGHTPVGNVYDQISVGMRKDRDDVLYIEVVGGHQITISPQASNTVRIDHRD